MAQENLKKFYEKVNGDEELQKKIKALADSYTGDKSDEKAAFEAVIAPIAKEAGYEFTYEEAMEAAEEAEDGEITEDEAAAAAGGFAVCWVVGGGTGDSYTTVCKYVGFGAGWAR
jgi:hypothetical protein